MSGNPWRFDENDLMHQMYRERACREITPRVAEVFRTHVFKMGFSYEVVWNMIALGPRNAAYQWFVEQCIRDYEKKTGEIVQ